MQHRTPIAAILSALTTLKRGGGGGGGLCLRIPATHCAPLSARDSAL